ncbi:MAG: isopentenyl-diphosphate Delta-isomerase [Bacteroidetes bacterium]|nr:isopentenyl-diphosphate Delta-isomerase [Bacteroidota bacterium]
MNEMVLLVDTYDRVKGTMDKLQAHQEGKLHRAYSVFIFNSKGELLMQRRALDKYHSKGLWTNTCCSHPRPGELTHESAVKRLKEEMGIITSITKLFHFVYMSPMEDGLFEHEFDHVFIGTSDAVPKKNESEVVDWRWASPEEITAEMDKNPGEFTLWFQLIFKEVLRRMKEK